MFNWFKDTHLKNMSKILLLVIAVITTIFADPAFDQLPNFRKKTSGPIGIMATSNGAPVEYKDTLALESPSLMGNEFFMDLISHQMEERIPERHVHAKGAGAFGYFEVTHNVTDICKAKLFSEIGKKTPLLARFSQTGQDKGEADTKIDSRGFAIKFFTEEGNFDIVCFHTPMFPYKDPFLTHTVGKIVKRNPVTNLRDPNMFWDVATLRPETMNFFLFIFGDNGIPYTYRHMPAFTIHTYQLYNKCGTSYFARFHIIPDLGIRNFYSKEANQIACSDSDYAIRDLYNAIESGNWPSWTVSLQVLSYEDVKKAKFDVFDITKKLPEDQYPLRPLGKIVLNKNPRNHFAEVEQAAFCPGNVVPGILGAPDRAFETRRFSYKAAQRHRLGANFNKILVNCPIRNLYTYERDGVPPVGDNGGDAPSYYPNSFHGPVPYVDKNRPSILQLKQKDDSYNFEQATELYIKLSKGERTRLVANIVSSLSKADKSLQQKFIELTNAVHPDLAFRLTMALSAAKQ